MAFEVDVNVYGKCDSCRARMDEGDKCYCRTCFGEQSDEAPWKVIREWADRRALLGLISKDAVVVIYEAAAFLEPAAERKRA